MATQSIQVKDFTGGRNFITSPFNIYPTEAEEFRNISLDSTGMRTSNFVPIKRLIPARGTGPFSVAPKEGEVYELSHAKESLLEKVCYFQGDKFIINGGIPYKMGAGGKLISTVVTNPVIATALQTQHTAPADGLKIKTASLTYFISYRNKAGFESPLKDIGSVVGHKIWDTNFTTETASDQVIDIDSLPAVGEYIRIYRMGDNISYPSLVCQIDSNGAVNLNHGLASYDAQTKKLTISMLDDKLGNRATTWGASYPSDLRYLASTKYGLAAAKGSQLFLSMNRPDAWSDLSMLNFGSAITGVASVYRGIVIFTDSDYMYTITGSNTENLQVNLVSTAIGCASNSSITTLSRNSLIWVYNRRFYAYTGTQVKEIEPNTYDYTFFVRHGFLNSATAIALYNKYVIGDTDSLVLLDLNHKYKPFIDYNLPIMFTSPDNPVYLRSVLGSGHSGIGAYHNNGAFYLLEQQTYGDIDYVDKYPGTDDFIIGCYTQPPNSNAWSCPIDNSQGCTPLMGTYGHTVPALPIVCPIGAVIGRYGTFELDLVPVTMESNYLSPMFTFGDMNAQVTFSSVEVLFEGELDVFVYIDDVQIKIKQDFASQRRGTARILLSNEIARGNFLQLGLRFNGAVYGYRINGEVLAQYSK